MNESKYHQIEEGKSAYRDSFSNVTVLAWILPTIELEDILLISRHRLEKSDLLIKDFEKDKLEDGARIHYA